MECDSDKKVYLIDGSGYIFRAYYALQHLTTSYGFPTNALYGFTKMLLKLLEDACVEKVVVCFDVSKETFRKQIYPEYKANRVACPEDLVPQLPFFRSICLALGLTIAEKEGFEADDMIGTLTQRLVAGGSQVVIVSGDKDLMQLVNDQVSIWDTMKDVHYGINEVQAKMGVLPDKIVDLLGLMGDSADNIPGLSGVGPKTAVQLIESYGGVEEIINSADAIANDSSIRNRAKISQQILTDADILRLSKKLAVIECNAPVDLKDFQHENVLSDLSDEELLDEVNRRNPDSQNLQSLIEKFEFSSIFKDVNLNIVGQAVSSIIGDYQIIYKDQFQSWLEEFQQQKAFSFKVITTSDNTLEGEICGIAFSWSDEGAYYIPISHKESEKEQIELDTLISAIKPIFDDEQIKKYGHDLKYDIKFLQRYGVSVKGVAFDTKLAAYLLNPDSIQYDLDKLSVQYLGFSVKSEIFDKNSDCSLIAITEVALESSSKVHAIWLLTAGMQAMIEDRGLWPLMSDIELPLIPVLASMELQGVRLDIAGLKKMSLEIGETLDKLIKEIYNCAGCEFNINSPKQLADILFNKLQIPTTGVKKTKTGFSTDSSVLEFLSQRYDLPRYLLDYRMLFKLKSTYIDVLPVQISPKTGRLHTTFNQMVTGTGRLSSSDPNLQNIPIMTEAGRNIRKAFIAGEGRSLISADYSQIELRILAHLSGDENLINAFANNVDIHTQTARRLLSIPNDREVTSQERRVGKTINFGVIYGMGPFSLSQDLGLPLSVAKQYIEDYFNYFSGVREYFAEIEEDAEAKGYVTTLFGRRRIISDIDTSGRNKGFLKRVALNAPIQGTAADIIKLAMIKVQAEILKNNLPIEMLLQIHDELVFECDNTYLDKATELIKNVMENVVPLRVPLRIGLGIGHNWFEAH